MASKQLKHTKGTANLQDTLDWLPLLLLLVLIVGWVLFSQARQGDTQNTIALDAIGHLLDVHPLGQSKFTTQVLAGDALEFSLRCHLVLGLHDEKTLLLLEVDLHFLTTESHGVDVQNHVPFAGGFISNALEVLGVEEGGVLEWTTLVFLNQ